MGGRNHRGAFVFGVIMGAMAGAVSTLLMAPKSGEQVRSQLKDQAGGVQQRLSGATSGVRERSGEIVGPYVDKVTQITQRGQSVEDRVVEVTKPASPVVSPSTATAQESTRGTDNEEMLSPNPT